jgi:ABC-type antimicrobial peptide transport system permease subunit
VTGVRRHRHDLGVLAALGFVRRQIASTTAWQAITVAGVSLLVGIPVGVAAGRFVWNRFADHLGAVVPAQSPVTAILVAVPVTIVLAVAVSLPPAWAAARTRPSVALRAE